MPVELVSVHKLHPGQCDPHPSVLQAPPPVLGWVLHSFSCWALGAPGPPTSLRSAGRKRPPSPTVTLRFLPRGPGWEGTFPVHTKVSLASGAQTWAQPLSLLPMEPALGPGVQVTSQGVGGGSQGEAGHFACTCGGCVCAWVCLVDGAHAAWDIQSRKVS